MDVGHRGSLRRDAQQARVRMHIEEGDAYLDDDDDDHKGDDDRNTRIRDGDDQEEDNITRATTE